MTWTVLLIEDNEQNRYLTTFLLESNGFSVLSSADGPSGIALARRARPDIILLDIQLPTMNGYSVARSLREIEELKAVPIVAVTSHAMVGDREHSLSAGCTAYIEKPINPETFVSEISQFLDTADHGRQSHDSHSCG